VTGPASEGMQRRNERDEERQADLIPKAVLG
jgi:hypothetical protein